MHHNPEIRRKINEFGARREPFVFAVDFDALNGFVLKPDEAAAQGILFDIGGHSNFMRQPANPPAQFDIAPVDFETYAGAFNLVQHHLKNGDTYLLNLTFETPVSTDRSLEELFHAGRAPFRLLVPGHFAVFSPEAFVTIRNGRISSCPMKGTIRADVPDAAQRLLDDRKEFFEHNTIVDLIRNDLSMVATEVRVDRFRYLDHIRTNRGDLLQMSSEISGLLPDGYREHLSDLLFTLLPAGSVTGAPKEKTVEIIRAAENYHRGFYTGIFGYCNGNELISAVSIRFISENSGKLAFRSGGGITALSDAASEYDEMTGKVYLPVV